MTAILLSIIATFVARQAVRLAAARVQLVFARNQRRPGGDA